uniref:RNA helicase n=1 Tax=Culicoides sonorensis TaxID=179676 RepID=A0A336LWA6_CULSO
MDDPDYIYSWYINPHLIWIRNSRETTEFIDFEHKLDQFYKENFKELRDEIFRPKVNDLVAYIDRVHSKWYRAVIDCRFDLGNDNYTYYLWLIDYGFPVQTTKTNIYKLEKCFHTPESFDKIFKVGLANVLPCKEEYDFLNEKTQIEISDQWDADTVLKLQKIFETSTGIEYFEKFQVKDQSFGEIKIHRHTGKILDLAKVLTKSPKATEIKDNDDFLIKLKLIETINIERYQDNNRQSIKSPNVTSTKNSFHMPSSQKDKNLKKAHKKLSQSINSESSSSKTTDLEDDTNDMPLLVTSSSYETETSTRDNELNLTQSSTEERSDTDSGSSKSSSNKLSKILEKLKKEKIKEDEEKSVDVGNPSKTNDLDTEYNGIMPSCYSQILAQEDRLKKHNYFARPGKNAGSSDENQIKSEKKMSKLDKIMALRDSKSKSSSKSSSSVVSESSSTCSSSLRESNKRKMVLEASSTIETSDTKEIIVCKRNEKVRSEEDRSSRFLLQPLVLIHGKRPSQPVRSYKNVAFTPEVIETMETQMPRNEIRRLQAHVWPHVMHENSAVIVGSPGSGKTSTLIPAICSLLMRLYDDEELPDASGPVAIIIAAFADFVSEIGRAINMYLHYWNKRQEDGKKIMFEESYGRHREQEIEANLLHGIGVLIATPPSLQRMLERNVQQNVPLFTKSRLKMLVVEDFDVVHNHYGKMICDQIQHFYVKNNDGNPTQLLITSSQWETQLLKYCHMGKNPALYIGNYIEASIYGGAQFRMSFAKKESKLFLVQKFVADDIYQEKRTVIICSTDEEVHEVCSHLRDIHVTYTSYTHDTDEAGRDQVLSWHEYNGKSLSVLVCSDDVLTDLSNLRNVQRLFHYSLPNSWSCFSFRFSVFFNVYHDFVKNIQRPDNYEPPFAQIVIDENSGCTLPRLIDFLKRVQAKIPPEVEEISQRILADREAEKKSTDLCPYFLHYAIEASKCPSANCRGRHAFLLRDKPTSRMPPHGALLKLKITCIHTPIHYSGQILAYRYLNERKWNAFQDIDQNVADLDLQIQLNTFYTVLANQKMHAPVTKGDICGWKETADTYRRVQVVEVLRTSSAAGAPQKVHIRLIDTGTLFYNISNSQLFILPESLINIPPRAVDIHHVGLVPFDGDMFWGRRAKGSLKYHIDKFIERKVQDTEKNSKNYYVKANVMFRVENHIWTKNLILCEPLIDEEIKELPIHKVLLRHHFAERDNDLTHLSALTEMAENLGLLNELTSPDYQPETLALSITTNSESISESIESQCNSTSLNLKPRARSKWDYLDNSLLHPIVIYHLENPTEFALIRVDRVAKMTKLYEIINEFTSNPDNLKPIENPEIGDNSLVAFNESYIRGRIIEIGEDEDGPFVSVFSCDYGQITKYDATDVFETSNEIVEFMAYTAIMGSFYGITVYDGDDILDKMWKVIQMALKRGDVFAKVINLKENLDWLPGIYYYDLVIAAKDEKNNVKILNQEFVAKGYAKYDQEAGSKVQKLNPKLFLKDLSEENKENESEENWEEFVGTYKKTEASPMPSSTSTESDMESLAKITNDLFGGEDRKIDFDDEDMINMMKMFKLEHYIPTYQSSKAKMAVKENSIKSTASSDTGFSSGVSVKTEELLNEPFSSESSFQFLINASRQPEVFWQQNDVMVITSIHLGDNHEYHLEIRKSHMIFSHFIPNSEPHLLVINFFGLIHPKSASHQIRGLNLIIRLPKQILGVNWPRLHYEDDKFGNVKYNLDTMKILADDFEPNLISTKRVVPTDFDNEMEDDDDEDELNDDGSNDGNDSDENLDDPLFDGII